MDNQYFNTPEEIWKPIPDFPGYDISDQGRVRSYWGSGKSKPLRDIPQRILHPSKKIYSQVTLTKDGKHFIFLVHRLVLEIFIGPCPPGMESRHSDGIPANCSIENLSWGTHSENMLDRTRHGTNWDNRGMNCPTAKLTDAQVLEIRKLTSRGITQTEIGKIYGVNQSHISRILSRDVWKHIP